ncbi:MAG: FecR domain-containing protein [Pseudomonadota bacterium]
MTQPPLQPLPPDGEDDASRLREEVLDWFVRRDRDAWGASDEALFQAWLQADARHRSSYAQWQAHWHAMDAIPADEVARLRGRLARDKAVQAAYLAAQAAEPAPAAAVQEAEEATARRGFLAPALAVAAMVAITAGTGLLGWRQWQAQPVFTQAFSTGRGQQAEVPLPDGSRLRLDTATRLEVAYYRQRREVRLLDGQAVFAVQAEAGRPFHVLAAATRVTVVGTRFAVRHTPGLAADAGVHVLVEEGKVRVARAAEPAGRDREAVHLGAGQQVASDGQGLLTAVRPVPGEGIAPWREYRVGFVDVPLGQALAELERYGSTGLVVRDPAVAALRLTGTFDPRDAHTLRRVLPSALPVRLQEQPGGSAEILPAR